jgi:hypothetical protein
MENIKTLEIIEGIASNLPSNPCTTDDYPDRINQAIKIYDLELRRQEIEIEKAKYLPDKDDTPGTKSMREYFRKIGVPWENLK